MSDTKAVLLGLGIGWPFILLGTFWIYTTFNQTPPAEALGDAFLWVAGICTGSLATLFAIRD